MAESVTNLLHLQGLNEITLARMPNTFTIRSHIVFFFLWYENCLQAVIERGDNCIIVPVFLVRVFWCVGEGVGAAEGSIAQLHSQSDNHSRSSPSSLMLLLVKL